MLVPTKLQLKTDPSENALVLDAVNSVDPSQRAIDCVSE